MTWMVERVARAICDWQEPGRYDEMAKLPATSSEMHVEHFHKIARVGIKAMREPTPEQRKAFWAAYLALGVNPKQQDDSFARTIWIAMIDAALAEKDQP